MVERRRKVNPWKVIGFVVIIGTVLWAYISIEQETQIRVDQTCHLFESDHLADVEDLADTYEYLDTLTKVEAKSGLNQFIISDLPEAESEARVDSAPPYCDEANQGLPEPDPVIPEQRDFTHLLEKK
jgi:hypothetical protein